MLPENRAACPTGNGVAIRPAVAGPPARDMIGSRHTAIMPETSDIRECILRLAAARGEAKSICPSEVARELAGEADEAAWRTMMPDVREAAAQLVEENRVRVTRGGVDVDARNPGGPIRITIRPEQAAGQ